MSADVIATSHDLAQHLACIAQQLRDNADPRDAHEQIDRLVMGALALTSDVSDLECYLSCESQKVKELEAENAALKAEIERLTNNAEAAE